MCFCLIIVPYSSTLSYLFSYRNFTCISNSSLTKFILFNGNFHSPRVMNLPIQLAFRTSDDFFQAHSFFLPCSASKACSLLPLGTSLSKVLNLTQFIILAHFCASCLHSSEKQFQAFIDFCYDTAPNFLSENDVHHKSVKFLWNTLQM